MLQQSDTQVIYSLYQSGQTWFVLWQGREGGKAAPHAAQDGTGFKTLKCDMGFRSLNSFILGSSV